MPSTFVRRISSHGRSNRVSAAAWRTSVTLAASARASCRTSASPGRSTSPRRTQSPGGASGQGRRTRAWTRANDPQARARSTIPRPTWPVAPVTRRTRAPVVRPLPPRAPGPRPLDLEARLPDSTSRVVRPQPGRSSSVSYFFLPGPSTYQPLCPTGAPRLAMEPQPLSVMRERVRSRGLAVLPGRVARERALGSERGSARGGAPAPVGRGSGPSPQRRPAGSAVKQPVSRTSGPRAPSACFLAIYLITPRSR